MHFSLASAITLSRKLGVRAKTSIRKALHEHFNGYKAHGFIVEFVHTDPEGANASMSNEHSGTHSIACSPNRAENSRGQRHGRTRRPPPSSYGLYSTAFEQLIWLFIQVFRQEKLSLESKQTTIPTVYITMEARKIVNCSAADRYSQYFSYIITRYGQIDQTRSI